MQPLFRGITEGRESQATTTLLQATTRATFQSRQTRPTNTTWCSFVVKHAVDGTSCLRRLNVKTTAFKCRPASGTIQYTCESKVNVLLYVSKPKLNSANPTHRSVGLRARCCTIDATYTTVAEKSNILLIVLRSMTHEGRGDKYQMPWTSPKGNAYGKR